MRGSLLALIVFDFFFKYQMVFEDSMSPRHGLSSVWFVQLGGAGVTGNLRSSGSCTFMKPGPGWGLVCGPSEIPYVLGLPIVCGELLSLRLTGSGGKWGSLSVLF